MLAAMTIATPSLQMTGRIRHDGRAKVTGSGRYTADLTVSGMLHGAFRFAGSRTRESPASTRRRRVRCPGCSR